jgi:ubiquinone/menaquinone biosynthesis C-methylase UbiE
MPKSLDPVAGTFDETAALYERVRPSWPTEAVRDLRIPRAAGVLDLGAGTGKLTRILVEHFDRVVAVEPLDGMRALLESLAPEADVLAGQAETIPLADQSVDAVFCAETFHWFDGNLAIAEIQRVLRPQGSLILLWNVPAKPTEPSIAAAADLLQKRGASERRVNRYDSGEWRQPFIGSRFEELREAHYFHSESVSREQLLAYFASMSWIAALPEVERRALLEDVRRVLDADTYTRFWRTDVHVTTLRA